MNEEDKNKLASQIEIRRIQLIQDWILEQLNITKERFTESYRKLRNIEINSEHVNANLSIYKLMKDNKQKGLTMFLFQNIIVKDGKHKVELRSQYIDENKK